MKKKLDPRMHSAEHILNQTMIRIFRCDRSFSAHIEKKKSKCDYLFERPPTEAEVREIEKRVNEIIGADPLITETFIPRREALQDYDLGRLPEDAGDAIRIVRVGDYDECPCIGAHVRSAGQIGRFRIVSTDFRSGVLRIRFKLAGPQ